MASRPPSHRDLIGARMRVAILGGIPRGLGGGGLEIQMRESARALSALGVDVVDPWLDPADAPVDVIHLFGADPSTWQYLRNANRMPKRVVVSPVVVVNRHRNALIERLQGRFRLVGANTASMRRDVIARADSIIALHAAEKSFLTRAYGLAPSRVSVVGNGSRASSTGDAPVWAAGQPYFCAVGTVGDRKQQLELARSWPTEHDFRLLIVGGADPSWTRLREFRTLVDAHPKVEWVGGVAQGQVWDIQGGAIATISASRVEGESLALIDSLALGRPVVVRSSSAGRALASRFGQGVRSFRDDRELLKVIRHLGQKEQLSVQSPPTWSEVAADLLAVYRTET